MLYLRHKGKPLVAKIIHKKYAKVIGSQYPAEKFPKEQNDRELFPLLLIGKDAQEQRPYLCDEIPTENPYTLTLHSAFS